MKSNDSSFKNSNTSKTETSETLKKKTTETDKKKTTKSDTTKKDEQTSTEITFTKNADGDYSFKLPDGYDQETFKLKVDFTFATTVDLHVNGDLTVIKLIHLKKVFIVVILLIFQHQML